MTLRFQRTGEMLKVEQNLRNRQSKLELCKTKFMKCLWSTNKLAYLFDKDKSIKAKRRNTNFVNLISCLRSKIIMITFQMKKFLQFFHFLIIPMLMIMKNKIAKGKFGCFIHKIPHIYFTRIAILSFGAWKRERIWHGKCNEWKSKRNKIEAIFNYLLNI